MCRIGSIHITDKDEIKNRELTSRVNYLDKQVSALEQISGDDYVS